jgi:hypothetical protein
VIQLSPPLIAGPAEFDEIVGILRPVLEEASERMHCQGRPGPPDPDSATVGRRAG